jgi:photosystem II stability/assembly factor-like uncharacterized protein
MCRILSAFVLSLLCAPSYAQWHKVIDFPFYDGGQQYARINCIYFLDKVGQPQNGFIGTSNTGLWNTSDGGSSWQKYLDKTVWEVYFKDSLTGWLGIYSGFARTTDGGQSWQPKYYSSDVSGFSFCYSSEKLFATFWDTLIYSTDLGNTWNSSLQLTNPAVGPFDSNFGLGSYFWQDMSAGGFLVSSNAGLSWDTVPFPDTAFLGGFAQPLVIQGSEVYFAAAGQGSIFRSDDHGYHWRKIYDFDSIHAGLIKGTLNRLVVASDSGFLVSTDQGLSWYSVGGPPRVRGYTGPLLGDYYLLDDKIFAIRYGEDAAGTGFQDIWESPLTQSSVITKVSESSDVTVYPNPTTGFVHIDLAVERASVTLSDMLGREYHVPNDACTLDVRSLPSGTYHARIVTAYGETRTVKIVKN